MKCKTPKWTASISGHFQSPPDVASNWSTPGHSQRCPEARWRLACLRLSPPSENYCNISDYPRLKVESMCMSVRPMYESIPTVIQTVVVFMQQKWWTGPMIVLRIPILRVSKEQLLTLLDKYVKSRQISDLCFDVCSYTSNPLDGDMMTLRVVTSLK